MINFLSLKKILQSVTAYFFNVFIKVLKPNSSVKKFPESSLFGSLKLEVLGLTLFFKKRSGPLPAWHTIILGNGNRDLAWSFAYLTLSFIIHSTFSVISLLTSSFYTLSPFHTTISLNESITNTQSCFKLFTSRSTIFQE